MVAGETEDACVEGKDASPNTKCNDCCKNSGFVRGKCSNLACYCCNKPEEKLTLT